MGYNIVILGSSGSIGKRAIDVIENLGKDYQLIGIAGGKNHKLLTKQAHQTKCRFATINSEKDYSEFSNSLPTNCQPLLGEEGMLRMVGHQKVNFILCAITGIAGLKPILQAIKMGKTIAFANKELLVMAGEIITSEAKKYNATILPVDSEHSAIFQCLLGHQKKDANRLILSCSGGPFRNYNLEQLAQVNCQQALNHPTWKMGNKITIDSATLMNKALEIIEAHWLFKLPSEKIDVIIHPQSIIHSLVEYNDGSVIAQLGVTDMAIPIQYALTYPRHQQGLAQTKMDWTKNYNLEFFPPNHQVFPSINMAKQVLQSGGTAPTIFNAANEIAVEAFLQKKISFLQIWDTIKKALDQQIIETKLDLETILQADKQARIYAQKIIK